MTALISETETILAPSACPSWCLGGRDHDKTDVHECVSATVELAAGVEAWLTGTPGQEPRVIVCGVAPELDSDSVLTFLRRLAALWSLMN